MQAAKAGYNILVAQSNEEYEQEVKIVHSFLGARVCGVITSLAKDTSQYDHYQELLNNNIPIVFMTAFVPVSIPNEWLLTIMPVLLLPLNT